jgi:hypothetical protein
MSKTLNPVTGLLEEQQSPGGATQIDPNYTGAYKPTASIAGYTGPTNAQGQPWGGGVAKPGYDVFGNPLQNVRTAQYDTVGAMLKPDITVDENKIREDVRKQQQSRIDAINSVYNDLRVQQESKNDANLGVQRAISARSGLLGSTMGQAQQDQVQQYNQQLTGSIESKRNLDIQAVYGEIDSQIREQIAAQEAKAKGQMDDYLKYLDKIQGDARSTISNMASSGIKLEDLAQEDLQKLLNNAQMSPIDAYALYQEVAQKSQAAAPKPIVVGGVAYQQQADGSYIAVTPEAQAGIAGVGGPEGGYKFIAATRYQPAGYFNADTGDFRTLDEGVGGAAPVSGVKVSGSSSSGSSGSEAKVPVTKDINGTTYQWDATSGKWVEPPVTGRNILPTVGQPDDTALDKLLKNYDSDFKSYIKNIAATASFKLDSNNIRQMANQFASMKAKGMEPTYDKYSPVPAAVPGTTGGQYVDVTAPGYTSKSSAGGLSQSAIDMAALAYAYDGTLPAGRANTGAGMTQNTAVKNRAAEIDAGGNIKGNKAKYDALTAALKEQTAYAATIDRAVTNADKGFQQIIKAFKDSGQNPYTMPAANQLKNLYEMQFSPGTNAAFHAGLVEVANEYQQVFARGGTITDSVRKTSQSIADGRLSFKDLQKVQDELQAQGHIAKQGAQDQVDKLFASISSGVVNYKKPSAISSAVDAKNKYNLSY